jgi:hypothetical protein
MNCWRRFRALRIGAACLALLPVCDLTIAQTRDLPHAPLTLIAPIAMDCTLCGTRWQPSALVGASAPSASNIPVQRRERLRAGSEAPLKTPGARGLDELRQLKFRDNQPLVNRLKRIQSVALLTVWDSRSATLYVGVNRDGEPGLHLRQKKYDRGTLAPANRTLFSDVTPWRAAALAGQSRMR